MQEEQYTHPPQPCRAQGGVPNKKTANLFGFSRLLACGDHLQPAQLVCDAVEITPDARPPARLGAGPHHTPIFTPDFPDVTGEGEELEQLEDVSGLARLGGETVLVGGRRVSSKGDLKAWWLIKLRAGTTSKSL